MKTVAILLSLPLLSPLCLHGYGDSPGTPAPHQAPATVALTLPLSSLERDDLAAAEQASMQQLLDIRGGDLTNENLWTILLVLGIVVLVLFLI